MKPRKSSPEAVEVILCVYWYPFNQSPSLVNLVHELIESVNIKVCVDARFTLADNSKLAKYITTDIEIKRTGVILDLSRRERNKKWTKAFEKVKKRKWLLSIFHELMLFRQYLSRLISYTQLLRRQNKSAVYICADKTTLLPCLLAKRNPRIYYSLEATPIDEENSLVGRFLNLIERYYFKSHDVLLISQTEKRADLIQPRSRNRLLIPVTTRRDAISKNSYIRKEYNINENHTIVSVIGGLGEDQLTSKLLTSSSKWADEFLLFVHASGGKYSSWVIDFARSNPKKIILSKDIFSMEQAEDLLFAGSDIGIVLYDDLGFNYRNTAYSSGKLSAYLRAGIPVLMPAFEEYSELLDRYKLGVQINDVEEVGKSLDLIKNDYEFFSAQARRAFDGIYHYKNYSGMVTSRIKSIVEANQSTRRNTFYSGMK